MRPSSPVLIVGAGIAGLTAALALARRDIEVRLIERAPELGEVGAGLQLSPNALRVLAALDILPSVRRNAVEAQSVTLKRLSDGRRLAEIPVRGDDGLPYLSLLRTDLQAALRDAVTSHPAIQLDLGTELTSLRREGDASVIRLKDHAGAEEEVRADVLIAADGVRSVAGALFGKEPARPTGAVAWRLMSSVPSPEGLGIRAWLGPGRHAVAYPVDGGRRTNLVVILPEGGADPAKALSRADPELGHLIDGAQTLGFWPIAVADRSPTADDPKGLLFIGDAAHAMEPYAAQGAALAIEDGYVAAACLEGATDVEAAWKRFAAERRERWRKVRRRVAFHRFVYHLPSPLAEMRNVALMLRSGPSLTADLAWLHDWRPPAK